MKNRLKYLVLTAAALPLALAAQAQYRNDTIPKESPKDTSLVTLTLNDALQIALSENVAVKVADKEIQRTEYAKKGTYASLFPQNNQETGYVYGLGQRFGRGGRRRNGLPELSGSILHAHQ